jgi:hypothetical protein
MALQSSLSLLDNFQQTIPFANCYIKVSSVLSTKEYSTITYSIYQQKDGFLLQQSVINFTLDLDGYNPIKQAYFHLKTLPEFANAIDC